MAYMDSIIKIRINEELKAKISKLIELYPGRFENEAAVARAGINRLFNREVDKDGNRKTNPEEFQDM